MVKKSRVIDLFVILLFVCFCVMAFGAIDTDADGKQNGWVKENGTYYYYCDGEKEKECFRDGYWLNADGSWTYPYVASWKGNNGNWWYGDSSGWYAKDSWYKIDGEWYHFDLKGYMSYDCFIGSYYLNKNGAWKETDNTEWAANISDSELASYFDNAVVIGDSVAVGFSNYCSSSSDPVAKKFTFLAKVSFSAHNAVIQEESVTPEYNGQVKPIWESIAATGTDHVYIAMGTNDIYLDGMVSDYETLIDNIRSYSPGIKITVCSVPGIAVSGEKTHFTNAKVDSQNYSLRNMLKRKDCTFIDINAWVTDGTGLKEEYASDGFVHETNAAYAQWLNAFKSYGRAQLVQKYDGE